ncbi:MAG: glucose 1-dehydrogenase [Deltaproteobacteria bacterium]|nr:glucose 1-dehydrogenase [Deltaproteobacteria bacterium]
MSGRVHGRVALVTGAASGLGAASATALAREGARVLLTDVQDDPGQALATSLGEAARYTRLDVTQEEDWCRAIGFAIATFGALHVLVNNAGIGMLADVESTSLEDWRRVHAVNLDGTFLGCKHAIPAIRASGGGSIINVSSISGIVAGHNLAAYNSSKAAVRHLTKSVALHCARTGSRIRCNSIHPTFVATPILDAMLQATADPEAARRKLASQIPLGAIGEPDDIAFAVVYLASDESKLMTGAELVLDGGLSAR